MEDIASISMKIQLDPNDLAKSYAIVAKAKINSPKFTIWYGRVLGVVLGLLIVDAAISLRPIIITIVLTCAVLMICGSLTNYLDRRSFLRETWNKNKVWHSPFTVNISADGIITEGIYGKDNENWNVIDKVLEDKDYFLLLRRNGTILIFPKRELKENGDSFKKLLAKHVGDRMQQIEDEA